MPKSTKPLISPSLAQTLSSLPPGAILGTPSHLLFHVPTPAKPSSIPLVKWATEHVKLLTSTLPGGLSVVAMYTPSLKMISQAVEIARQIDAQYVLTASSSKRPVLKNVPDVGRDPRSVEFRTGGGECLHVSSAVEVELFGSELEVEERAVELFGKVVVKVRGDIVVSVHDERVLAEDFASDQTRILLPLGAAKSSSASTVKIGGGMQVQAFLPLGATYGALLAALREDLSRSIKARMHAHRETMDDTLVMALPVRVVAKGKVAFSDYVVTGEEEAEALGRLGELLSWGDGEGQVTWMERFAEVDKIDVVENPAESMKQLDRAGSVPKLYVFGGVAMAFVVLIVAILIKMLS